MDGLTSLIREKWQPACFAANLKLIRYKRALTSTLVKFSWKTSYFHFFISSRFCKTTNQKLVSFSFNNKTQYVYLIKLCMSPVGFNIIIYSLDKEIHNIVCLGVECCKHINC